MPVLGLTIIVIAFNASGSTTGYSLKLAIATCFATSLCCIFEPNSTSITETVLSNPLSTLIGRLSYSLYLWHWPVIVFGNLAGLNNTPITLFIIVLLSISTYFLVENPFRQMEVIKFKKWIPVLAALLVLAVIAPTILPRESVFYSIPQFESNINLAPKYGPGRFGDKSGTFRSGLLVRSTSQNHAKIALMGDSHSLMFFPAVNAAADAMDANLTFFGADGGTSPFLVGDDAPSDHYVDGWTDKERVEFDRHRLQFIYHNAPNIVVLCGRWEAYYTKWGDNKFRNKFYQLLEACPKSTFLLIEQPPILPFGSEGFTSGRIEQPILRAFKEDVTTRKNRQHANTLIRDLCEQSRNAKFCSLNGTFDSGDKIRFRIGSDLLYKDDDHLSIKGSRLCDHIIKSALESISRPTHD
jgi:hypothetical protein